MASILEKGYKKGRPFRVARVVVWLVLLGGLACGVNTDSRNSCDNKNDNSVSHDSRSMR